MRRACGSIVYLAPRVALVAVLACLWWFGEPSSSPDPSSALPWLRPGGTFEQPRERPWMLRDREEAALTPPPEPGAAPACPFCAAVRPSARPRFPLSRQIAGTDCSCGRDLDVRLVVREAEIWRGCSLCLRDAVAEVDTR